MSARRVAARALALSLVTGLVTGLVSRDAHALDPFATVSGGGGIQNVRFDGPPPNLPPTQGYFLETTTLFTEVTGRAGLLHEGAASRHQLSYQAGLRYQLNPLDIFTLSHLAAYQVAISVGEDASLTIAVTGAAARANTLSTLRGAGDPVSGGALPPPSTGYLYALGATETYLTSIGRRWGMLQSLALGASYVPDIEGPAPLTGVSRVGPTVTWEADQLRATFDTTVTRGPRLGQLDQAAYQISGGPTVGWRHQLYDRPARRLQSTLEAGLVGAWDLTTEQMAPLGYAGSARLRYTEDFGSLEAFAVRAYTPSLFNGQILITNAAGVGGRKPILEQRLAVDTTLTAQRSEAAITSGPAQDSFNTFIADMGVGFTPSGMLLLSLRYQLAYQEATSLGPGFRSSTLVALATFAWGSGAARPGGMAGPGGSSGAPGFGPPDPNRENGVPSIGGLRPEGDSAEPLPSRGAPPPSEAPAPAPVW